MKFATAVGLPKTSKSFNIMVYIKQEVGHLGFYMLFWFHFRRLYPLYSGQTTLRGFHQLAWNLVRMTCGHGESEAFKHIYFSWMLKGHDQALNFDYLVLLHRKSQRDETAFGGSSSNPWPSPDHPWCNQHETLSNDSRQAGVTWCITWNVF